MAISDAPYLVDEPDFRSTSCIQCMSFRVIRIVATAISGRCAAVGTVNALGASSVLLGESNVAVDDVCCCSTREGPSEEVAHFRVLSDAHPFGPSAHWVPRIDNEIKRLNQAAAQRVEWWRLRRQTATWARLAVWIKIER